MNSSTSAQQLHKNYFLEEINMKTVFLYLALRNDLCLVRHFTKLFSKINPLRRATVFL